MFGLGSTRRAQDALDEARRRDEAMRRVELVTDDLCDNAQELKQLVRRLREGAEEAK